MNFGEYIKLAAQWNALSIEQQEMEKENILYKDFLEKKKKYSVSKDKKISNANELISDRAYQGVAGFTGVSLLGMDEIFSAISLANNENSINSMQSGISQKTIDAVMRDISPKNIDDVFGEKLKYIENGINTFKNDDDFKRYMRVIEFPMASEIMIKKMQGQHAEMQDGINKMMGTHDKVSAAMQFIREHDIKHQLHAKEMFSLFDVAVGAVRIMQAQDAALAGRLEIVDLAHNAILGGSLLKILDQSNINLLAVNEMRKFPDDWGRSSIEDSYMSMEIPKENSEKILVSDRQEITPFYWIPSPDILAHDLVRAHANNDWDEARRIHSHKNFGPEAMFSALSLVKNSEEERNELLDNSIHNEKIRLMDEGYKSRQDFIDKENFINWIKTNNIVVKNIPDLLSNYRSTWPLSNDYTRETIKNWYLEAMPDVKLKGGRPPKAK